MQFSKLFLAIAAVCAVGVSAAPAAGNKPTTAALQANPLSDLCSQCCATKFAGDSCKGVACLWCPKGNVAPPPPAKEVANCDTCCKTNFKANGCANMQCLWCPKAAPKPVEVTCDDCCSTNFKKSGCDKLQCLWCPKNNKPAAAAVVAAPVAPTVAARDDAPAPVDAKKPAAATCETCCKTKFQSAGCESLRCLWCPKTPAPTPAPVPIVATCETCCKTKFQSAGCESLRCLWCPKELKTMA
ncbi:hypothetical protein HDU86_004326 [Geranomyces michiganensis]|nr:hypothetical protein HDU86_004326 [Geranomyces michiganensis]